MILNDDLEAEVESVELCSKLGWKIAVSTNSTSAVQIQGLKD